MAVTVGLSIFLFLGFLGSPLFGRVLNATHLIPFDIGSLARKSSK